MITHYLKIALRNLSRQKGFTLINITGLSIGLACFILFLLYSVNELSFDRFHHNADNIYRVYRWTEAMQSGSATGDVYLPMPLGPAMKQDIPDVKNYVRIKEGWDENYVKVNGKVDRIRVSFADPQLFSVFSFPLKQGSKQTALTGLNNIVLTEDISRKWFGNENCVGQTIEIKTDDGFKPFIISAVAENIPSNSSIRFEALGSFNYLTTAASDKRNMNNWNRSSYITYVELPEGSRLAQDANSLVSFRKKYYPNEEAELRKAGYWKENGVPVKYGLQPLLSLHTDTKVYGGSVSPTDPKTIWILLGIAFGILMIACINFTTLTIGRSAGRAKEIGVRKVVGSSMKQLSLQFLSEAVLLTVLSVLLGLGLCQLLLPFFNDLSGKSLSFSFQQFPEMIWMIIALAVIVSLLAGSYPALVLSRFNPLEVLKQKVKVGGANFFTRSLVSVQFILSIGLIASTIIIVEQMSFMTSANPGFNKENVVVVNGGDVDGKKIYPLFKQALMNEPSIAGIASSELGLGEGTGWSRSGFDYKGDLKSVFEYFIDHQYIPLMKMEIIRGRNFDPNIGSDTISSVIVNEAMARDFGWHIDSAVGQTLTGYADNFAPVVIGVVKDFHFRPLSEKVQPQMFHQFNDYTPYQYFVRLKPGDPSQALSVMSQAWRSLVNDIPFSYNFLDESLDNFYQSEVRWSRIIGWAAGISIFLASLGLFGLAALAAVNRTKEIGIRKVMGASLTNIVTLLSKDFMKLLIIAFVIATPLSWYFMDQWLQDFAYRINIGWWMFAVAAFGVIVIALVTISFQSVKAALQNPIKSLRTE